MSSENVFLFVPNIIGVGRIILAVLSCIFMPNNPGPAVWCYLISVLLDVVDGHAARFFKRFWKGLAIISFRIALAKWGMAILQGTTAARNLANIDLAEREVQSKIQ